MTNQTAQKVLVFVCAAGVAAFAGDSNNENMAMEVHGGTATFVTTTNVPGITVKGKANAVEATVAARRTAEGIVLERVEAFVPVKALGTGMSLRDQHMRKLIFTTADGQTPDVRFEAAGNTCSVGKEGTCQIAGNLTIRGVARPFTLPLKIREDGSGFKATGDGTLKLSAYGIEQPSQLGVKTSDDVQLHLEFTAQRATVKTVSAGGPR